jgi:hypothetical protein
MVRKGRAEALVCRSDVSFRLDQKTGNFKAAFNNGQMQGGDFTEENQKCQLAQAEFRVIKTMTIRRAAAITRFPSPQYQNYTAAKDGKGQGGYG